MKQLFPISGEASCCSTDLTAGSTFGNHPHLHVLQRAPSQPHRAVCPKGHWLQPTNFMAWFQQTQECGVCCRTDGMQELHVCDECTFALCGHCLSHGVQLGGVGVFADLMTLPLARALLNDNRWLRFKSYYYFFKADDNGCGSLDALKMRRVVDRLSVELGVRPLTDMDINRERAKFCTKSKPSFLVEPTEFDFPSFERFFHAMLCRITCQYRSDF